MAASGGNITGAVLGEALASNAVTIQTSAGGTHCVGATCANGGTGTNGDIFVNDAVSWSAATKLTLSAHRNIKINANITAQNVDAQVQLDYGQDAVASGNSASYSLGGGTINLEAGDNFVTKLGSDGVATPWKVITSLGIASSTTRTDLQGINGDLGGNYVLGSNIDASATSGWNGGAGFLPIGDNNNRFSGSLDGLGHTITGLSINRGEYVGLFGFLGAGAMVQNLGLIESNISGSGRVDSLAGANQGTVSASYTKGSTFGGTFWVWIDRLERVWGHHSK
ncbi:hypothetical protein [Marinobacter sp. ELB17]|uniref:hypothetical protein n=1 Tax=Marinobacter sp. ELB17 TaxID=270374 RepID=UPI0000F37209|nr:hypothetical protein [Marinobacter sp. ELB17]EAZ98000.1 probable adhesin [Marinobacter sp. ELB17]